jgi:fumarate hydratase, class I
MAVTEFVYQDPFPVGKDDTEYRQLTRDHVSIARFDGQEILKIEPLSMGVGRIYFLPEGVGNE